MKEHFKWMMTQDDMRYNIECLDKFDFSRFFKQGMSLQTIRDNIEEEYDGEFYATFKIYVFDYLDYYDMVSYFSERYDIYFQEYTDWVVRKSGIKL